MMDIFKADACFDSRVEPAGAVRIALGQATIESAERFDGRGSSSLLWIFQTACI